MRRMVLDMDDRRPVFAMPDADPERIRAELPDGWALVVVQASSDGSGDGSGLATEEALAAVADAEAYLGLGIPSAILDAGPHLRWVHTGTAGVGSWLTPRMRERDILFTNSAGVFGPAMAETVLAFLLHFARGLHVAQRGQRRGTWDKTGFDGPVLPVRVVVTAPGTEETAGMLDAGALARMQPHAVLVNVGRGRIVDEDALVAALRDGTIGGAALDVFATEPLPDGHPLWTAPNVLITPHVSAYTEHYWEREVELVVANVRRYVSGQPLLNVVDKSAGY
ncbi:MAG: D-2-hydroxyacid dehydrogenase [Gemmatimonadota bacterium]